jgi:hypothetical protein
VLSLAKAAKDYYLRKLGEVSPGEDYYLRGGTATGTWRGSGASELGLEGTVLAEGLVRLFDGEHPGTGERLGRRLRRDGVAAWDLTFSADKSVSLLWALGNEQARRQVLGAFEEATAEAVSYLESVASSTRGARRVPVTDENGHPVLNGDGTRKYRTETWPIQTTGYVAASFTEFTSRADDPQLHTHVVVGNRVRGTDGAWRALDGRLLYRHQLAAGYLHEAVLRRELTRRLGVRWQPVRNGMADVEGFTRTQIEAFSRRRAELEAWREEKGLADTAAAREVATLATRSAKADHPLDTLVPGWRERATAVGLTPSRIASVMYRSHQVTRRDPGLLFENLASPEGLTARVSSFGRAEAVREVAGALPEGGTRAEIEALADAFLGHREVIPILPAPRLSTPEETSLGEPQPSLVAEAGGLMCRGDGTLFPRFEEPRYSTAELLRTEQRVVARALAGVGAGRWRATERQLEAVLRRHRRLTWGQRTMVRAFATSGNSVEVGVGPAGSGKTAVMAVLRDIAWRTGTPIHGAALAARAAAGLQAATGIPSSTLTRFLGEAREIGLPPRSMVVVDEAAMVGTRTLAAVADLVEQAQGKLILVGDHRQLPELEAGGLFRALVHRLPAAELTDNIRQQEPWERQALAELRDGSVSQAVETYRAQGRIVTGATPNETLSRAVGDWYRHIEAGGDLQGTLLIAHSNATVAELNRQAQEQMAQAGRLGGPALHTGEGAFRAGDRVLCRQNHTRLGVLNGDLGTVVDVDPKGGALTVRFDRHGESRQLPAWYLSAGHLGHGYALTGHKAQGVTVRRSFIVAEASTTREWTYVAMSRGQEANTLYLVDPHPADEPCTHLTHPPPKPARALAISLGRSSAQIAALDLREPDPLEPPPPSSDVAARVAWLAARRKTKRELEARRGSQPSALERYRGVLEIGR